MPTISKKMAAKLFHRVDTAYRAGIDMRKIWEREGQSTSPVLSSKSSEVLRHLNDGKTLAESMNATNGYFPPLVLALIRAGEQGGRMEDAFKRLADHYQSLVKFRQRLLTSFIWPVAELCIAIFVVGVLILVLGWILASSNKEPIDWLGLGWGTMAYFMLYVVCVCLFFGSIFVVVFGTLQGWFGQWPMKFAKRVPVIGKLIENLSLSRFSWATSATLGAGINVPESVGLGLKATQNFYYEQLEPQISQQLATGDTIYNSLLKTEEFDSEFLSFVENGEISGELPETLERVSRELQSRVEQAFKVLGSVGLVLMFLFVATILIIAIFVLFNKLIMEQYREISCLHVLANEACAILTSVLSGIR